MRSLPKHLPKALLLSHHCCCFTCQRIAPLAQRFCPVLHPPPRSGVSPVWNTRVTTVVSVVGCRCAPQPELSPGSRVFCYPRPRGRTVRIRPYALPGSDSPAGTARQSIELEESATLWDLLQPGRVALRWRPFLASTATRPEPVPGEDVALGRRPFLASATTRPAVGERCPDGRAMSPRRYPPSASLSLASKTCRHEQSLKSMNVGCDRPRPANHSKPRREADGILAQLLLDDDLGNLPTLEVAISRVLCPSVELAQKRAVLPSEVGVPGPSLSIDDLDLQIRRGKSCSSDLNSTKRFARRPRSTVSKLANTSQTSNAPLVRQLVGRLDHESMLDVEGRIAVLAMPCNRKIDHGHPCLKSRGPRQIHNGAERRRDEQSVPLHHLIVTERGEVADDSAR